jgi:hypothetical protein
MTLVCLRIAKKFEWRESGKPDEGLVYFVAKSRSCPRAYGIALYSRRHEIQGTLLIKYHHHHHRHHHHLIQRLDFIGLFRLRVYPRILFSVVQHFLVSLVIIFLNFPGRSRRVHFSDVIIPLVL